MQELSYSAALVPVRDPSTAVGALNRVQMELIVGQASALAVVMAAILLVEGGLARRFVGTCSGT